MSVKPWVSVLKTHPVSGFGFSNIDAVTPDDLQKFLADQDKVKTATVAFVDCQDDADNQGKKFTGAYQLQLNGMADACVAFQAGGKGVPYASALSKAHLVVFNCRYGATRSPNAMASYLKIKPKTQKVVLLEGGMAKFEEKFPNYKIERWNRPTFRQVPAKL